MTAPLTKEQVRLTARMGPAVAVGGSAHLRGRRLGMVRVVVDQHASSRHGRAHLA